MEEAVMNGARSRRKFFKQLLALSAFSGASFLSLKKNMGAKGESFGPAKADAMENPDYAIGRFKNRITIDYYGMSCFLIRSSNGTRIITDPFLAEGSTPVDPPKKGKVLHAELRKEPADVVTVSCGHYAHCNVYAVGGTPFIYKIAEPTELHGVKFRGIATRHLTMNEIAVLNPAENIIICFEVDGIRICHLGALGHRLSDEQVKQIGKVDILMAPVGGVSTLPGVDAGAVCSQLNPRVILPMHYRSDRCTYEWAEVDEFLKDKRNVLRCDSNVGSSQLEFALDEQTKQLLMTAPSPEISSGTQIIVPRCVY
jgi:L-ascorbate metabolism protein UlaG (beta-lactamase superfamily)